MPGGGVRWLMNRSTPSLSSASRGLKATSTACPWK
nr:MAG TPA: hypothetical protein [Caudoviricetes sp.]